MSGLVTIARFSVVVVPFPYSDQLAEKRRPALVISKPEFLDRTGLVWVAMITSAKNQAWADDIAIPDHMACGLPAPSLIRPTKIATIDGKRVVDRLGSIGIDQAQCVRDYLVRSFE